MSKLSTEIDKIRDEIVRTQDEIKWVDDAPLPRDELKTRAAEGVRALATRFEGADRLRSLARPTGSAHRFFEFFEFNEKDEAGKLLAWAMGDALIAHMHAEIDRLDYRPGPATADRPVRLTELRTALRALEEREEALIMKAEDEGVIIARRADADPAVVLAYDPSGEMFEGTRFYRGTYDPTGPSSVAPPTDAPAAAPSSAYAARTTPPFGASAALPSTSIPANVAARLRR